MAGVGFSSWAFPQELPERVIDFAHREGFDGIELAFLTPGLWEGELVPGEGYASRLVGELGALRRSVHTPIAELAVASPDPAVRRRSHELLVRSVEATAALGAEVAVVHLRHGEVGAEASDLRRALEPIGVCAELAASVGVRLGLENYGVGADHADQDYTQLRDFIDELGHPAVGITLDTGHAHVHLEGPAAVTDACALFGDRIIHYHVHDNHGSADEHLELGAGTADLSFLGSVGGSRAAPAPLATLEVFPFQVDDATPGLRRSRDALREALDHRP